jgi:hypothetical protein
MFARSSDMDVNHINAMLTGLRGITTGEISAVCWVLLLP